MKVINILEPKNETQISFEYLKNNIEYFCLGYPNISDSDLKGFFKDIVSEEEENIDSNLFSRQILTPSKKTFIFLQNHGNLYSFCTNVLENESLDNFKLLEVGFLKDLMNGFKVYKKYNKSKKKKK